MNQVQIVEILSGFVLSLWFVFVAFAFVLANKEDQLRDIDDSLTNGAALAVNGFALVSSIASDIDGNKSHAETRATTERHVLDTDDGRAELSRLMVAPLRFPSNNKKCEYCGSAKGRHRCDSCGANS